MPVRQGRVAAWILYDVAAHGYGLMIPSVAYAIYFTSYVAADTGRADLLWSLAVSVSLLVSGVLAPWIGAVADTNGRGRSMLAAATLICGLGTALLFTVGRGDVFAGAALFVVAQVGATLGGSLYNSFLPHVAGSRGAARLSGFAWGLSYLGGVTCFLLCLPFTRGGLTESNVAFFANTFLVTAAFLLAIGLPAVAAFPTAAATKGSAIREGPYQRIWLTIRQWRRDREVPKFLLAYYLVNDAVVTVLFFTAVMMKKTFGLELQEVLLLSLALQAIAIPSTALFGWLGGRWSQRGAIYVTLGAVDGDARTHGPGARAPRRLPYRDVAGPGARFHAVAVPQPLRRHGSTRPRIRIFRLPCAGRTRFVGAGSAPIRRGECRHREPALGHGVARPLLHRWRRRAEHCAHSKGPHRRGLTRRTVD